MEIESFATTMFTKHQDNQKQPCLRFPPIHGGVADGRLGTFSADPCYTCGHSNAPNSPNTNQCPGHFGRINLATPVPNYLYLTGGVDSSPLSRTLKYVCMGCSKGCPSR